MNEVTSYRVEPAYTPKQGVGKIVDNVCRYFHYQPKWALLIGSAMTVGASLVKFSATSSPSANLLLNSITTIGTATLLGVAYQWKHLPANLMGVPLLSLFGIQWRHGMGERKFEERKCFKADQLIGELQYEKQKNGYDIPILKLYTKDPYDKGLAHGYLLGKEIDDLFHRVLKPLKLLVRGVTGDFSGSFYQKQFKKITIPEPYARELEGMLAGVKAYAKEMRYETDLTQEDAHSAHKITDIYKSILCQRILGFSFINAWGCSMTIVKQKDQIGVGRTLDWASLGEMGKFSLVRQEIGENGEVKIEFLTYPGLINALTAHNGHGLIAIINECGMVSQEGVPYSLLARQILENARSMEEAKAMIDQESFQPASSHHLILVDSRGGINFQMLVSDEKYISRTLPFKEENECLVVTNHAMEDNDNIIEKTIAHSTSKKRFKDMSTTIGQGFEQGHPMIEIMRQALLAVNTKDTIGAAIYTFQGAKVVPKQYVYDNNFAALHLKPLEKE
jgi:hypothetical protein